MGVDDVHAETIVDYIPILLEKNIGEKEKEGGVKHATRRKCEVYCWTS
jgi:hypothetical protein